MWDSSIICSGVDVKEIIYHLSKGEDNYTKKGGAHLKIQRKESLWFQQCMLQSCSLCVIPDWHMTWLFRFNPPLKNMVSPLSLDRLKPDMTMLRKMIPDVINSPLGITTTHYTTHNSSSLLTNNVTLTIRNWIRMIHLLRRKSKS